MARSNSQLSRKNSLYGRRREFPDTALKLLCYLARMPRLRGPNGSKFPAATRIGLAVRIKLEVFVIRFAPLTPSVIEMLSG